MNSKGKERHKIFYKSLFLLLSQFWVVIQLKIESNTYIESIYLIILFEWYQPLGETHFISYICTLSVCERKATQILKHEENEQYVTSTTIASIGTGTWNEHNCIYIASYMLAYCLWSFSSTLSHLIYGKTC